MWAIIRVSETSCRHLGSLHFHLSHLRALNLSRLQSLHTWCTLVLRVLEIVSNYQGLKNKVQARQLPGRTLQLVLPNKHISEGW